MSATELNAFDGVYSVRAIETIYRGVRYRSRLEARWAAYFDLVGIRHLYEPLDFDGWTPDFLLTFGPLEVACEIKPVNPAKVREVAVGVYDKALGPAGPPFRILLGHSPGEFHIGVTIGVMVGRDEANSQYWTWIKPEIETRLDAWFGASDLVRAEYAASGCASITNPVMA
jgi:hypothetical protein